MNESITTTSEEELNIPDDTELVEKVDSLVEVLTTQLELVQEEKDQELLLEEEEQQEQQIMQTLSDETALTNELLIDLTKEVEQLNAFLEEKVPIVEAASSSLITYSVFYVPLIIIVLFLWWFFKQFLTDFR